MEPSSKDGKPSEQKKNIDYIAERLPNFKITKGLQQEAYQSLSKRNKDQQNFTNKISH